MTKGFELGWQNYTQLSEIEINPKLTTFLIFFKDVEKAMSQCNQLDCWLIPQNFELFENTLDDDYLFVEAKIRSKIPIRYTTLSRNLLAIRCNTGKYSSLINDFLDLYSDIFPEDYVVMHIARFKHGLRKYELKSGFKVREYSGRVDLNRAYDFLPKRFYEVKFNDTLVAKALVSFYNDEMDEVAPTIDPIEVSNKHRNSGIGRRLVRLIERVSRKEGFDRVWASDIGITGSTEFWRKIGYEIDFDEAVKYLD